MNAAIRFITGTRKYDHITTSYVELGVLKYSARRDYLVLCLLATILHRGEPTYIAQHLRFVKPGGPGSHRRSALDLVVPRARTNYYQNAFIIFAARRWNELPEDLRSLHGSIHFRTLLHRHIFESFDNWPITRPCK